MKRILVMVAVGGALITPTARAQMAAPGPPPGAMLVPPPVVFAAAPASGAGTPAAALPPELKGLGVQQHYVRRESGRHGAEEHHYLRLGDGRWIRAKVRATRLIEVHGEAVPPTAAQAVLPPSLHRARELAQLKVITEVSIKPRGEISVEGKAGDGSRIEVEYDRLARLLKYEREHESDRHSLTETQVRELLVALKYRDVAILHRGRRHVDAIAINAYAERVEVRINDRGTVDRERMLAP